MVSAKNCAEPCLRDAGEIEGKGEGMGGASCSSPQGEWKGPGSFERQLICRVVMKYRGDCGCTAVGGLGRKEASVRSWQSVPKEQAEASWCNHMGLG